MSKTFSELTRTTGFDTMGINLDKYSLIQVVVIPNGNIYNEMIFTINTQRLKVVDYQNIGISRIWYENQLASVHATIGFSSGGAISLEGCKLISLDGEVTSLRDNTTIIIYGV